MKTESKLHFTISVVVLLFAFSGCASLPRPTQFSGEGLCRSNMEETSAICFARVGYGFAETVEKKCVEDGAHFNRALYDQVYARERKKNCADKKALFEIAVRNGDNACSSSESALPEQATALKDADEVRNLLSSRDFSRRREAEQREKNRKGNQGFWDWLVDPKPETFAEDAMNDQHQLDRILQNYSATDADISARYTCFP